MFRANILVFQKLNVPQESILGPLLFLLYVNNMKQAVDLGMSSLFINLILKTSHYLHMKVLNERISEWVHLYFYHKRFLRYLHLKFEKEVIFLERFSPYEITESGDKISNF